MLSKAQNKYIRSLTQQKYRKEYNVFIAEGDKIAREWLASGGQIELVVALESWLATNKELIALHPEAEVVVAREQDLESISTLQTPNQALLVVKKPGMMKPSPANGWAIAVEGMQDPGNMGTIIRIADWFGIATVYCSPNSVDVYNPKVVQAAMGGHIRVGVVETDLLQLVANGQTPVYAATLHGDNIYSLTQAQPGIILIGNESKGLSDELIKAASHKVTIPGKGGAESLNAAVSAGILCALLIRG